MAGRPVNPRTPYLVCVRYEWRDEPTETYAQTSRKRLCDALQIAWDAEVAWLKLIGGQRSPLEWLVIDARDYAEYRRGIATRFGETDGKDENGHPYARRASGAGLGGNPAVNTGRGNRGRGGTGRPGAGGTGRH